MVDSGASGQSEKILTAIARLTSRPVRFLINTNDDADHIAGNGAIVKAHGGTRGPRPGGVSGGNPRGPNAGVMTMAHENAFNRMSTARPGVPALTGDALPSRPSSRRKRSSSRTAKPFSSWRSPGLIPMGT